MRIELRVCKHCFDGTHENEHKTAVTRDLVACARVLREHIDKTEFDDVHIRMVSEEEGDDGRPAALPAVAATIQGDQVAVSDTQLITMGEQGYMMVYPNPQDALKVLAGNIDELSRVLDENVLPELSAEGSDIIFGGPDESGEDEADLYQ